MNLRARNKGKINRFYLCNGKLREQCEALGSVELSSIVDGLLVGGAEFLEKDIENLGAIVLKDQSNNGWSFQFSIAGSLQFSI